MEEADPCIVEPDARKRKAHKKSRKGCGNCKLRRVKCDENKPQCEKCISYGVECNYDAATADELHLPGEGAISFSTKPHSHGPPSGPNGPDIPKDSMSPESFVDDFIERLLGHPLKLHNTTEFYYLTKEDIRTLYYFKEKTVYTIGTQQSVLTYRHEVVKLMISAPYLIHVVLTLAIMHERYASSPDPWQTETTPKESFHWYHGSAIFNNMLSQPIREEDKDALWGTAALLGAITIGSVEARTAEESWPLAPPSTSDLDWLRMSDGKKEVWRLTDPLRQGSCWRVVMNYDTQQDPEPYSDVVPELNLLYPFLIKIYDFNPLSPTSEHHEDPYHTAASILVRLLELDCNYSTIMYFLSFLGHMDTRYRELLHQKDPKALLLLAWWYGKMCQYNVWWQSRRMVLEGQAICLYLEKYHPEQEDIIRLLDYPKMMTGLVSQ